MMNGMEVEDKDDIQEEGWFLFNNLFPWSSQGMGGKMLEQLFNLIS